MKNTSENDILNYIDDFFKSVDISLAELEKIGSLLIIFGYSNFFYAADVDILETKEINNTGKSPSTITATGQQYISTGYVILWVVSIKRMQQIEKKNIGKTNKIPLAPYRLVANTYLLSVFANALRLEGFTEIDKIDKNKEFIE